MMKGPETRPFFYKGRNDMPYGIIYGIAINLLAFALCGLDKAKAKKHAWRIPERTLLAICALGGAPLFWVGMQAFHHKTRHRRFSVGVPIMAALWIGLAAIWIATR